MRGWGATVFSGGDAAAEDCAEGVSLATGVSAVPAAITAAPALGSWLSSVVRRAPDRLDGLLALAAAGWLLAEAILFVGGCLTKP